MPTLQSPAKVNLFLEVLGRRPDGYHDLASVFLEIDFADEMTAVPTGAGVSLRCDNPAVPAGDGNLAVRAARLLARECGVPEGIEFFLHKRIPLGGGLGGGSSNAATALVLANELWKTGLTRKELAGLGLRVGSDVPFFLHGGACLVEGRGERITPLPPAPPDLALTVILSRAHSDTAAAFRGVRLAGRNEQRDAGDFVKALTAGDVKAMGRAAFNRFEETVFAAYPELGAIRDGLGRAAGIEAHLSGSGSALWCFGDAGTIRAAMAEDAGLARLAREFGVKLVAARPRGRSG